MTGIRFIPALVGILILLLLAKNILFRTLRYYHLKHIPGPATTGWSRLWLLRQAVSGKSHFAFFEANKQYGPIAKVGPYHVITSDPGLIRRINAARSPYTRGEWWHNALRFHPDKDNLCTLGPAEHTARRAKMAPGYSGRDIGYHGVEAAVDRTVLSLVRLIESRYIADNKPFDFGRKAQYFTLDVIADLAYGEPFGFVSRDEDMFGYLAVTEEMFAMFLSVTIYPWVYDVLASRWFKFLLPSERDRTGFGRFMAIAKEKAAERFGPDRKIQSDMLGSFVRHGLTQVEAEAEILLQIIAGSDSTSTAIRAIVLLVITTPRVYTRLLAEIVAATASLERWLDAGPAGLKAMEATMALTFGYGKSQCLGKEVALMELNKVFVELLRRFELSVVDPTNPWESACANIFLVKNFWIKAQNRTHTRE
ncbi:hypothetical protein OQA88_9481 [Cercophora sp. LCS_1]